MNWKKVGKGLAIAAAAGVIALGISACGGEKAPVKSAAPAAEAPKTVLRVGTTATLAKWIEGSDDKSKDGGLQGFEVDLLNEAARRNHWEIQWTIGDFAGLWGSLDNGSLDTIANPTTITEARKEKYDFTDPYAYAGYVFITKDGQNPDNVHWFEGKQVVVEGSSNPRIVLEKAKEEQNLNLDIQYIDTENALLMSVLNGTYDSGFVMASTAFIAMKDLGVKLDVYDPHFVSVPDVYAFRRTNEAKAKREALSKTIEDMHKDGTLKKLSMKWFGADFTSPDGVDQAISK